MKSTTYANLKRMATSGVATCEMSPNTDEVAAELSRLAAAVLEMQEAAIPEAKPCTHRNVVRDSSWSVQCEDCGLGMAFSTWTGRMFEYVQGLIAEPWPD